MFFEDAHAGRARAWLQDAARRLSLSDWTLCELTSALGVIERRGLLTPSQRRLAESQVDAWVRRTGEPIAVSPSDVRRARQMMNATSAPLRAADALHLAIAERTGCSLATFDEAMRRAASALGLPAEDLSEHD